MRFSSSFKKKKEKGTKKREKERLNKKMM